MSSQTKSDTDKFLNDPELIRDTFGASRAAHQRRFAIYIPDRDKYKNEFDPTDWIRRAMQLLDGINGGVTALPAALAMWHGQEEHTVIVYSFIDQDNFYNNRFLIRAFLHEFGRMTNQGEVLFELGSAAYWIDEYDFSLEN